ncbi:MAG: PAS domain S-box protein, partial [Chloroflexi bacterium]|nr:PAS domain S-box protein [Chloroflexota bacterium]
MTPEKKTHELIEKQTNGGMAFGENFFRLAFERSADALLLLENGVFTDCNEAAVKMLRAKSKEEILITQPSQLSPQFQPDGQPSARKAEEMIQTASRNGNHRFEWHHRRMDGEVFPVEVLLTAVKLGGRTVIYTAWREISERKKTEDELKRTLNFTNALLDALPTPVFYKDKEGRYQGCNRAFTEVMGKTDAEIRGKTVHQLWPSEHAEVYHQKDLDLIHNPQRQVYEATIQDKDANIRPVIFAKDVFLDESGHVAGLVGTFLDISEQRKIQEALRVSEQRYETIFNSSPVMFWLKDTKNNMIQINQAAADFEGMKPEEVGGHSSYDLYPREQAEAFYRDDLEVIRSKKPKLGIVEKHTSPGTGKTTWLETGKVPVLDDNGEVKGVLAFAVDITEREKAAEELRRFQLMVQNSSEFINMADLEGNVIFLNAAGRRMVGVAEEDVQKQVIFNLLAESSLEKAQKEVLPAIMERGHWAGELQYRNLASGGVVDVYASAYMLRNPETNEPQYLVNISRDITEQKRSERALRENQQLLQLVMNNIPQSVFWKDSATLSYMGVNQAFAEGAGFASPEDMIGKNDFDMPWKEQAELYRADDRQVLESGVPKLNYEEPQTSPSGEIIWLRTSKIPMRNVNGEVFAVLGMYEDITERKRLETQLQQAFEKRGYQVQISTEIAQELSAAAELNELFERVVTLTKERLGYYHTQLLRYDPALDAVALVSGYGEIGRKMLADGHKMPLGSGLIGVAAATGETVMRPVLAEDPDWHPNPLLPETKGEIAVPIKLGDQILGVLDVQSDKEGELTEDDRLLLKGLCGQIAVAIEQTRLRQEMTERLEEVNRLYRAMSREGWKTYRETGALPEGFMFDQSGLKPLEGIALASERFVQVPMKVLGGEVVGDLAVADDPQRPLSPEDLDFLEQISEQVALALESARLSAQTQ